jgi:hypothetical protein
MAAATLAQYLAQVVAYLAQDGGATVTCKLGEEFVADNDAPPRVVFVPSADRYTVQMRSAGTSPRTPRSPRTRMAGLKLHCWAAKDAADSTAYADLSAAELLVHRVVCALHSISHGAVEFEGGEWTPAGLDHHGRVYTLSVRLALPITPPVPTTTSVTVLHVDDVTATMDFPSSDVSGSPAP